MEQLKNLMSGIAVVIDDKLDIPRDGDTGHDGNVDLITKIVERFEQEWNLPFYKAKEMPEEETWPNLLRAASFVLLDWRLWPSGGGELERLGIETNIRLLMQAKNHLVPVFIFSNENREDIVDKLPTNVYDNSLPARNFIFVQAKTAFLNDDSLNFEAINAWVEKNASVYTLKAWEQVFHAAKKDLFGSMYAINPDWPKVFWKSFYKDRVDPGSSLANMIFENLRGRMRTSVFRKEVLGVEPKPVPKQDLRKLIGAASFRAQEALPWDEIRCGDLFKVADNKFLVNIRPDCDCIPRKGKVGAVKLYCVEGKNLNDIQVSKKYEQGHFHERVWESVAFSVYQQKTIGFDFRKFCVKEYSELKDRRIGRLLHPYVTRIQQRYTSYLQRQGHPRIPEAAVNGDDA